MWVAREKNNDLYLHEERPLYLTVDGYSEGWAAYGFKNKLDSKLFPELTFENSPLEVSLIETCLYNEFKDKRLFEDMEVIHRIKEHFGDKIIKLDPDFSKVIDENFWDIVGENEYDVI